MLPIVPEQFGTKRRKEDDDHAMFTGLVERVAKLQDKIVQNNGMTTFCFAVGEGFDTAVGDSVAIDGCCLTVTKQQGDWLYFDLSSETLKVTALRTLSVGQFVNVERALQMGARLGGHMVTGHVDGVAEVTKWEAQNEGSVCLEVALPQGERGLVVAKGSLCLAGVSLTVNSVNDSGSKVLVTLTLIPHTLKETNLQRLAVGSQVNYETDLFGKYVRQGRTAYTC